MAGIRGKDTKPELAFRRSLHALCFRYRLHLKGMPGKPDIVLPKYKAVIFVHGCFWHQHPGCRYASMPTTRPDFWMVKFAVNVNRDIETKAALLRSGWRVGIVWECGLRNAAGVTEVRAEVAAWLAGGTPELEVG